MLSKYFKQKTYKVTHHMCNVFFFAELYLKTYHFGLRKKYFYFIKDLQGGWGTEGCRESITPPPPKKKKKWNKKVIEVSITVHVINIH